jgi:hypothetical protein
VRGEVQVVDDLGAKGPADVGSCGRAEPRGYLLRRDGAADKRTALED